MQHEHTSQSCESFESFCEAEGLSLPAELRPIFRYLDKCYREQTHRRGASRAENKRLRSRFRFYLKVYAKYLKQLPATDRSAPRTLVVPASRMPLESAEDFRIRLVDLYYIGLCRAGPLGSLCTSIS